MKTFLSVCVICLVGAYALASPPLRMSSPSHVGTFVTDTHPELASFAEPVVTLGDPEPLLDEAPVPRNEQPKLFSVPAPADVRRAQNNPFSEPVNPAPENKGQPFQNAPQFGGGWTTAPMPIVMQPTEPQRKPIVGGSVKICKLNLGAGITYQPRSNPCCVQAQPPQNHPQDCGCGCGGKEKKNILSGKFTLFRPQAGAGASWGGK